MDESLRARTLGVLGNGQLGRMLVQAAHALGLRAVVFDPQAQGQGQEQGVFSPAAQVSDAHVCADFLDTEALQSLAQQCCAVTTEFENVPAQALAFLAQSEHKVRVTPGAHAVRIAQDRRLEKAHFQASGVATAPYHVIEHLADLHSAPPTIFPAILKTARLGYDGKGQIVVPHSGALLAAWDALANVACVLEQRLNLAAECSVLLARNSQGQIIHWPMQHNVHVGGILASTQVDWGEHERDKPLFEAARKIAQDLDYVGVLCIEFFVLHDGSWAVNEFAPRPHNSGHITMNTSSMSQFEAQARIAADLPLVQPRQHCAGVMLNLLGDVWLEAHAPHRVRQPDWSSVLALGSDQIGVHLHLYGKGQVRVGRKMGHINITAQTLEAAWQTAGQIQQRLRQQQ